MCCFKSTHHIQRIQRGFSLVETLVALTIGLTLLTGFVSLYVESKQTYNAAEDQISLQENGRYAIELLSQEIARAGYFGDYPLLQEITGTTPPIASSATCDPRSTDWGRMLTQPIFGLDDTAGSYACIPRGTERASYYGGDLITVRYAAPFVTRQFDKQRLYLRTAANAARLFVGRQEAHPANTLADTRGAHEVNANSFYVAYTGRKCQKEPVLGLFRKKLNYAGVPESEELIPGIEDLQIQYGIDANDDTVTDYFADANSSVEWTRVHAVRLWVLVRSECPQARVIANDSFKLGNKTNASNDKFRRRLFTATIAIFNQVKVYAPQKQI